MDSFRYAQILFKYRPRSEREIRDRLCLKGYNVESVEKTVEKLNKCGLIDDFEFVKYWLGYRLLYSLRSKSYAIFELKKKGVSLDVIEEVLKEFESIDEKDTIFKLAKKKAKSMNKIKDHNTKMRRLYAYLGRRGFSSLASREAIKSVLNN